MSRKKLVALFAAFALAACVLNFSIAAHAQTETVIYNFGVLPDGQNPIGGLIFDHAGNLYGTTSAGGNSTCSGGSTCGTVFELSPASGGGWTETILYRFTGGSDGWNPNGTLLMDASGNLFGTAAWGGMNCGVGNFGCGVVFKLSPDAGGTWTGTTLYTFTGAHDGAVPLGGLVADSSGNLYGTTSQGGNNAGQITGGAVFQLVPNGSGGYNENSIFTFHGVDGAEPVSTLAFDHAGNLYGTTEAGGTANTCASYFGCGVVFKLTPTSSGPWTEKVIHFFSGQNGQGPREVTFDAAGNLYGPTRYGGLLGLCFNIGCGVAYELSPNGKGGWEQTRIFKFAKTNGWSSLGNLVLDGSGNAYGTTEMGGDLTCGGKNGCGVAFKLNPGSSGWSLTLLHVFGTAEADGEFPEAGVVLDSSGNLYGTTTFAGLDAGTVFEITP
jgi:hypothetical protein